MRLLFVSQVYFPEPVWKPHDLASGLVELGHEVTVLTAVPNHPHNRFYEGYRRALLQEEQIDGVRVVRVLHYPYHGRSAGKRTASYLSFALLASTIGPIKIGKPQLIWAFQSPLTVGIPTLWLKVLRGVPVVYEIQDLWPETLAATGMVSSRAVIAAVGVIASGLYHTVDALVVQSPGMKQNLVAKGVSPGKVSVIPNWADEDLYRPVEPDPRLAAAEGMAGRFNVVFAGNLGSAQGLRTLLDAAILLRDHPRIQFVFVGDGVDEPTLRDTTRALGLRNVLYLGRRPAHEMPGLFALASALIVHLKKDPLFAMTIPSKIPAYLASGRPIVAAVEGDAAAVVRDVQAGIVCPPEDPEAIARALVTLDEMSVAARERLGRNGRETFLRSYARRQLIPLYENLFFRVARAAGRSVEI